MHLHEQPTGYQVLQVLFDMLLFIDVLNNYRAWTTIDEHRA